VATATATATGTGLPPIPPPPPPPPPPPNNNTCAIKYPNMKNCDDLRAAGYNHTSLKSAKAEFYKPPYKYFSISEANPGTIQLGTGEGGLHVNYVGNKKKGDPLVHAGSISKCQCCQDIKGVGPDPTVVLYRAQPK
jgi:hypothetical protein